LLEELTMIIEVRNMRKIFLIKAVFNGLKD